MEVKVKDFNPKYDKIEFLIIESESYLQDFGIANLQTIKKEFGEYYVYSYKDFDDTKSTSVMIGKAPLYDCKEDTTLHWIKEDLKRKGVIKWVITYITHIKPMAKKPIL